MGRRRTLISLGRWASGGPRLLVAVVAVAAALRIFAAMHLPLSGDEAYHWEWSRHLAGAYYDHPGMTAWSIAVSRASLPDAHEIAVRLPALLFALLTTGLAFGLAVDVARGRGAPPAVCERAGVLAAALVFFTPLPAALSVYMSTDPPLLPCWLGAVWAFHRALTTGSVSSWVATGACLGLALSTKLTSLPLLGTFFLVSVAVRDARRWWRRPHPWLAIVVMLAAAAPMLWWNAGHDWQTFRFNFAIRQREQHWSPWYPLAFLGGQAAVVTPGFMVLALVACCRRAPDGWRSDPARLAVSASVLLPLVFLGMVSLRREVGVHWAAASWPPALVLLAVALATGEAWTRSRSARFAWRSSWVLTAVVLVAAHAFALAPTRIADLDLVAGQPRRVLRNLFGWREVGAATAAAMDDLRRARAPGQESGVFAMSNQYGTAAALAFYTPGQPHVHLWSAARNHGRSYLDWDDWSALRGQDAVYVSKRPFAEWELPFLAGHFATVSPVEEVPIVRDGTTRNTFFLVRCRGFDGRRPFPPPD